MERSGRTGIRRRCLAVAGLVLVVAGLGLWCLGGKTPPPGPPGAARSSETSPPHESAPEEVESQSDTAAGSSTIDPDQPDADPAEPQATDEDERLSRQVVGTWEDEYKGKRTMTLREDGTGSMVVELTGLSAWSFAPRLEFEMVWSVGDGQLRARTTGGEPAMAVSLILATYGDHANQSILELTDDRLLLLDEDGTTEYDWQRVR